MKSKILQKVRAGFSLIEVNMAIFVLAGGALALLGLFPLGLRESLAARNEMRVAAFAERAINAARIAAASPDLSDVDDLRSEMEKLLGASVDDNTDIELREDTNAGVWYRVWVIEDPNWPSGEESGGQSGGLKLGSKRVAQVGVQVTAENAKRARKTMIAAPTYVTRVVFDVGNED